jgi:hypothetical protein
MPEVKLENTTAHIMHISMGGGQTLAIPPTEGGIMVMFTDAEKVVFDANVATPAVQEWVTAGDLIITETPINEVDPPPVEPPVEPPPEEPPPVEEPPARSGRSSRGRYGE